MFAVYCYDTEFDRYADAMNYDGTCDSFITNEEYNKRMPCELNSYCVYDNKLYQVWCISYHKDISVDEFRVNLRNVVDEADTVEISASIVTFLTREEAEQKLEGLK
jgi:hypothetical protein